MFLAMRSRTTAALAALALGLTVQSVSASAVEPRHEGRSIASTEWQHEPRGYMRPNLPEGADRRPANLDRDYMRHNYRAQRGFAIGPYRSPGRAVYRRWVYGDILPSIFWDRQYWLSDYWLFGLDVPPTGYEWVRYWNDAVLVNVHNGEIVQVVYGNFV